MQYCTWEGGKVPIAFFFTKNSFFILVSFYGTWNEGLARFLQCHSVAWQGSPEAIYEAWSGWGAEVRMHRQLVWGARGWRFIVEKEERRTTAIGVGSGLDNKQISSNAGMQKKKKKQKGEQKNNVKIIPPPRFAVPRAHFFLRKWRLWQREN